MQLICEFAGHDTAKKGTKVIADGAPDIVFAAYSNARSRWRKESGGKTLKVDGFHCLLLSPKGEAVGVLVVEPMPCVASSPVPDKGASDASAT